VGTFQFIIWNSEHVQLIEIYIVKSSSSLVLWLVVENMESNGSNIGQRFAEVILFRASRGVMTNTQNFSFWRAYLIRWNAPRRTELPFNFGNLMANKVHVTASGESKWVTHGNIPAHPRSPIQATATNGLSKKLLLLFTIITACLMQSKKSIYKRDLRARHPSYFYLSAKIRNQKTSKQSLQEKI
jgi:hypothetical protein